MLETQKYVRKQFDIDAVQISEKNMADIAAWVGGRIETDDNGKDYVKVDVKLPLNNRQSKGYVGDWVLSAPTGFKVYNNKAFRKSFEQVSVETTLHDVSRPPEDAAEVAVKVFEEAVKP